MSKIKDRYQLEPYEKIPDVWILNSSFQKLGLIDDYTSLIWSRRYYEVGDFELYVRVTDKNMKLLNVDLSETARFIMRNDTKEVMRIEKIEISVDAEEGDFITASGRDLKCLLYQRCTTIDEQFGNSIESPISGDITNADAVSVVEVIYALVNDNLYNPTTLGMIITSEFPFFEFGQVSDTKRKMPNFTIGSRPTIDGAYTSSMVIDVGTNIGEKVEELCNDFRIGWEAEWNGSNIVFRCYEGADRTASVIFSEQFSNLVNFTNTEDLEDFYNVMILKNTYESDGVEITDTATFGEDKTGYMRFEKVFTASEDLNVSKTATLRDLLLAYKLPSSYQVIYCDLEDNGSHMEGGSDGTLYYDYIVHNYGSDVGNPRDSYTNEIGDEVYHKGSDYMASGDEEPNIIITFFEHNTTGWWGTPRWYLHASFLNYEFRCYTDEWKAELMEAFPEGELVTHDGIEYLRVHDILIGESQIQIKQNWMDSHPDIGRYDWGWNLIIPAEYSEDGQEMNTYANLGIDGSEISFTTSKNEWLQRHLVPFSFEFTLSDILLKDRYMAKAYSMVEEALSTNEFEGEIAPDVNYKYREDYDIGDKIRIKTDIGIQKDVRILEAVETFDSDGYNIEVKFGV